MGFNPDLFWRSYPAASVAAAISSLPQSAASGPPSSPLMDVKPQLDTKSLPSHLSLEPRNWCREDVVSFLRWVEREYDLPTIDHNKFCMNGKALIMLTKVDLTERAPDAGDILHNTLQQIISQSAYIPPSPITPHHPILSTSPFTSTAPANQTQTWTGWMQATDLQSISHLLQQNSSVTLSPAHSEQSGGSPRHPDSASTVSNGSAPGYPNSGSQSDSEDSNGENSPQRSPVPAPLATQASSFPVSAFASLKHYQRAAAAAAVVSAAQQGKQEGYLYKQQLQQVMQLQQQSKSNQQQHLSHVTSPVTHLSHPQQPQRSSPPLGAIATPQIQPPTPSTEDTVEPGTNGRLLWDFLQQLLNDKEQRYARYIAWRNAETGVFKIVDPPGLARLWGIQKNHLSMNYDKMSRALRYYYRVNILRKVQGERHCYQFLRNPSELRNIKNISSLKMAAAPARAQVNNQNNQQHQQHLQQTALQQQQHQLQQQQSQQLHMLQNHSAPAEEEGPTDLSMTTRHNDRIHSPHSMNVDDHYENTNIKMEDEIAVDYEEKLDVGSCM